MLPLPRLAVGFALLLCLSCADERKAGKPGTRGGALAFGGASGAAPLYPGQPNRPGPAQAEKVTFPSTAAAAAAMVRSEEFRIIADKRSIQALVALPSFAYLAATPAFLELVAVRSFGPLVNNGAFHSTIADPTFAAIVNDHALAAAIARGTAAQVASAIRDLPPNGQVTGPLANSAEVRYIVSITAFVYMVERPSFVAMLSNPDFRALMSEPCFGQTVVNFQPHLSALLRDPQFCRLVASGELPRLMSSQAFRYLAQNQALAKINP